MRHVSRTHRVALDWLFDRINLDPQIQIRYVDSKNQLADVLTKGHFTRDEWNHLLCFCSILAFSALNAEFSSQNCSEAMAKRQQEGDYDERVVATSKPVRNLVSRSCAGPSTKPSSTVSSCLGKFGSKDHEMGCETRTEKPSSANQRDRINLDPKLKNKHVDTPKTMLLTFWPKALSLVMHGTIFFVCSTS